MMGYPLVSFSSFFFIAVAGSYLFFKLRIPAGIIIGPILIFTLLKLLGFQPVIPAHTDSVIISVFGVYFATRVRGIVNLTQRAFFMPLLLTVGWFIGLTFFSSFILRQLSDIGTTNSYLSVIPGGIAEMNIITLAYNANVSIINAFHLTRLFSVILLVPALLKVVYKDRVRRRIHGPQRFFPPQTERPQLLKIVPILVVGASGSIAFILLDIPAGGLMGALLFVVIFETVTKTRVKLPEYLFVIIVSLLGGTIGLNIDIDVFRNISHILMPVAIITLITISGAALLALLIHLLFRKEYLTTLLGVMPGGLAVMLSIAESATRDTFYVASLQTIRLLTAVVIVPNLLLILGIIVPQ